MAKFDSGCEGYPIRQTGQPTLAGHTTYHVNVIKIKRAIIWTGGLPQLRVTSPTWGPPHPCKQALSVLRGFEERRMFHGEWKPLCLNHSRFRFFCNTNWWFILKFCLQALVNRIVKTSEELLLLLVESSWFVDNKIFITKILCFIWTFRYC